MILILIFLKTVKITVEKQTTCKNNWSQINNKLVWLLHKLNQLGHLNLIKEKVLKKKDNTFLEKKVRKNNEINY